MSAPRTATASRWESWAGRRATVALLYALGAAWIVAQFVTTPGMNPYYRARVPDLIAGTAYRPYQYRLLFPLSLRVLTHLTPQSVQKSATDAAWPLLKPWLPALRWDRVHGFDFLLATLLIYALFVAWAYTLRALANLFYELPPLAADLAPLLGLAGLPLFFVNTNFLYDPATLLLFTLATLLIAARSRWYGPVFVLCCLNKETAALLPLLFWMREATAERRALNGRQLAACLGAQWLVWLLIKTGVSWLFRHNPGQVVEWTWRYNVALFQSPARLMWWGSIVVLLASLSAYRWREKPLFVRRGFLLLLAPLTVVAVLWGIFDELRAFYELYPFLFLLALPSLLVLRDLLRARPLQKTRLKPL